MGELRSIVGILFSVVSRLRDQCSVCDAIAAQFVGDYLSGYTTCFKKTLEESFRRVGVSSLLQIYIDDFAILINRAPKVVLFASNLYENFI